MIISISAAGLVLLGGLLATPALVEQNINRVYPITSPAPSAQTQTLHRSLWIADLHADSLLWQRYLNQADGRGHLDFPRLAQGNVALQAFSVVTKTPRKMNIGRNLSDAQLKRIAAQGGLVGIGFWNTAVCGKDVQAIARAVKHAVSVMGVEHVAYGSDFDGAVTTVIDAAGLPRLTQALLDAGLSAKQIRRIAGENVRDFLLKNLPDDDA